MWCAGRRLLGFLNQRSRLLAGVGLGSSPSFEGPYGHDGRTKICSATPRFASRWQRGGSFAAGAGGVGRARKGQMRELTRLRQYLQAVPVAESEAASAMASAE